ncbi:MAG: DUF3800 domain-containing protein [Methanobrevibacter sp.]|uniref:DUF3800 domain-containing protein n=1 Tax=uncultured Methanobrevibacter sp. TaxID=253161 RepID=UPI0025CEA7B1|nr:DUF3800 domain-containing protein [uncultured Methanobrevibacter sp.]MBQ2613563.1 DUF3800 domain-containing protein [Methanobrevibacter sp.]
MSYIYIDESGDLGTKKASSKYFIMAAIKVEDSKKLEKIIKKTRRDFKKKMLTSNEVKGGNLPYELKIKILEKLKNIDYKVFIIVFDKENRYKIGYGDNKKAYDILASRLAKLINIDKPTFIFIDKSKNKQEEIENFNELFLNNLNNIKKQPITIEHADSMHYKGLQMADLISWSTFQNFENDNPEFLDIIKNKVVKLVCEN